MPKTTKPDFYSSSLSYRRPDSRHISGYGSGGATLKEAVESFEKGIAYYLYDSEMVNEHVIITEAYIDKLCGHCTGTGVVRKRGRMFADRVCPVCKGKAVTRIETWYENERKVVA